MFFLSLALLGQSAPLDADDGKAARQCFPAFAAAVPSTGGIELRKLSQLTYLSMVAAKAEGAADDFTKRWTSILSVETRRAANAPITVPTNACDQRFPLSRATAPAVLPAAPLSRDTLCFSVATYLSGAAKALDPRTADAEYTPLPSLFGSRLASHPDAPQDAAAFAQAFAEEMRASLNIGNVETILESCSKLPA